MVKIRTGLTGLFVLTALTLTSGCMPASPEGHAKQIHKEMQTIYDAAMDYKSDHGSLPHGDFRAAKEELISGGYIKLFPQPHPSIFGKPYPEGYRLSPQYDTMDAGSDPDYALGLWRLKDEICKAFNNLYSSNNSGPTIFDFEAAGKKYPGEVIGSDMLVYAIKWKTKDVDNCEVNWVLKYE
jgi:hypothetical protein